MSVSSTGTNLVSDSEFADILGGAIDDNSASNAEESASEIDKNDRIEKLLTSELEGSEVGDEVVKNTDPDRPLNVPEVDTFKQNTGLTIQDAYQQIYELSQKIEYDAQLVDDAYRGGNLSPEQYNAYQQDLTYRRVEAKEIGLNIECQRRQFEQQQSMILAQNREQVYLQHPELRDDNVRQKAIAGITNRLRSFGYSDAEISNVYDPRLMSMLYQTWKSAQKPAKPFRPKKMTRRKKKSGAMNQEKFKSLGRGSQDRYLDQLVS